MGRRYAEKHPLLAARIRQARKQLRMSRDELAMRLGVALPVLASWECNRVNPSVMDVCRLVAATGLPFEFFLGREENADWLAEPGRRRERRSPFARRFRQMQREALAAAVGVEPVTVLRWELGELEPTLSELNALSSVLGVPTCYLLGNPCPPKGGEGSDDDGRDGRTESGLPRVGGSRRTREGHSIEGAESNAETP